MKKEERHDVDERGEYE